MKGSFDLAEGLLTTGVVNVYFLDEQYVMVPMSWGGLGWSAERDFYRKRQQVGEQPPLHNTSRRQRHLSHLPGRSGPPRWTEVLGDALA